MAKTGYVKIDGVKYTLQSMSPTAYYDLSDRFKMGTPQQQSAGYVDALLRNVVVEPREIAVEGLEYFDDRDDISTPNRLAQEIESFLKRPDEYAKRTPTGKKE